VRGAMRPANSVGFCSVPGLARCFARRVDRSGSGRPFTLERKIEAVMSGVSENVIDHGADPSGVSVPPIRLFRQWALCMAQGE
jgi:hypothetical protein